ncbi:LacI family DNA-binding transcriptional regulator [Acidithrix ferrooxidans]|uniref:Catabolite control protein A n=1 Tax=Acidithrix ferrooxidans TaxID=1280514 RepID=A0A0D8HFU3_9ACTN|nr:LacI family DNA-binding transcriptional regulator [Acidithrix ferrooxidans]KJF16667.1 catabolite control protein A [Acidithrix ferrooxidans]
MSQRPTIYAVAKRCGVSTTTVSRVMQDESFGSPATRERVLSVALELGWVPNGAARGLATRKAGIIGLLFPDLGELGVGEEESPLYVDQVVRGAERVTAAAGQAVLIAAVRASGGKSLAYSVAGKVDGLVIMSRSLSDKDVALIARTVPVVLLAHKPGRKSFDHVVVDNRSGAREMTSHLIEVHGYQDLVYVRGPEGSPDSHERFLGFCDSLEAAGLPVPEKPAADGGFTEAGGKKAMWQLLGSAKPPRAIVFGNDEMAIGAMDVLNKAKISIPGEVAITGFDDIAVARHVNPSLTTVKQPMRELGEQAVQLLFARLRDPKAGTKTIYLSTESVFRKSCGCGKANTNSKKGSKND